MNRPKNIWFSIFLLLAGTVSYAQNRTIDSLKQVIENAAHDTIKVKTLNTLAYQLLYSEPAKAYEYSNKALALTQEIKWEKGIAQSHHTFGNYHYTQSDYPGTLDHWHKALKIYEASGNQTGIAKMFGSIGIVHHRQGDYPKALEYYFKSLKIEEEQGNKSGIARTLGNIGVVYSQQGNYPKALEHYFKSLNIKQELGNKSGIAATLGNIGNVYSRQGNYPKALEYHFKRLNIEEELNNKSGIATTLGNIGLAYRQQGDSAFGSGPQGEHYATADRHPKALEYYSKALKMDEELGNKNGIAIHLGNIGSLYAQIGKFAQAEQYLKGALAIDTTLENLEGIKHRNESLSQLYDTVATLKEQGEILTGFGTPSALRKLAFEHYKKHIAAKDSMESKEQQKKQVRLEMTYEFEKKQGIEQAEHEKQLALAAEEKKKQQIITYSVAGGLLLVLFFAGFILRSLRIVKRQKTEITKQKALVDEKNRIVEEQKLKIEEKHKEVTDSIRYAKRIQEAILPSMTAMHQALKDGFVLYKPKDVVAGDFYWLEKAPLPPEGGISPHTGPTKKGKEESPPSPANKGQQKAAQNPPSEGLRGAVYFAAADCTGHGVPGAMVSVICSNALSKALLEEKAGNTGELLDKTRAIVINRLAKSAEGNKDGLPSENSVKDGMDISLCAIDFSTGRLQWSGANNPLWIIRNGELIEYKHDKQAIGIQDNAKPFTTHSIELQKNDTLYIITDGYQDQFGGPKGKKFRPSQLKEKLLAIQYQNMDDQKITLDTEFENWKGQNEQVDDVCIIGVRV